MGTKKEIVRRYYNELMNYKLGLSDEDAYQKIKLLNTILPYGLVTKDTALELLDMHPIGGEEGAKILQSLNNIDSSIANSYQGGGNSGKES